MTPRAVLVAILPCGDLDVSEAFYARLGFSRDAGQEAWQDAYRMLSRPDGSRLHLRQAEEGWLVPDRNPFGLYLYAEDADALAEGFASEIIGAKGAEEEPWGEKPWGEKPWGMIEFALSDPDGTLVRIGRSIRA